MNGKLAVDRVGHGEQAAMEWDVHGEGAAVEWDMVMGHGYL